MSVSTRLAAYKAYLEAEFSEDPPSLGWRVRALLTGHPSKGLAMLDDGSYRSGDYFRLTLYRRRIEARNLSLSQVLSNKLDQKLWLDVVMPSVAPPTTHYLAGRKLISLSGDGEVQDQRALLALLAEKGELFIKPSGKGQGAEALRLVQTPDGILANDRLVAAPQWLEGFSRKHINGYIVSDIIAQGAWSEAFFPRTLNTLRVLTGTHFSDHRPIVLAATMKMGRPATYPTDNWKKGSGGVAALVNVDSGILSAGLFYNKKTRQRDTIEAHPESGARILGASVPNWSVVKSIMLKLAAMLPFPGLVGWDVALTEAGIVVVEGNIRPGLDIHQCHGSLKQTAEQRAFWAEMRM
ncbi:sugar-transfer associated ATP-grasp domain-containing protein [Mesorhizobium neociceri]|uniref:Alpha-L-glutamate ligase-related protein ATP-grasp domain-containing protein n=1 Tax=Mesorhizobium neociceri TaxID=1307853 RepID=A0A838BDR1_9HYPH|nr:sugar-transfer associated ATP-grasp domain-containing protein [Mesorhizobium neociceri]MBA1144217.1 hypothetical protein [Mesorhizobium neociceri]